MKKITKFECVPYNDNAYNIAIYYIVYRPYHLQNSELTLRFYTQSAAVFTRVHFKIVP